MWLERLRRLASHQPPLPANLPARGAQGAAGAREAGPADNDVDREIRHYLEEAEAEYRAQGLTPDEARRAARLDMGAPVAVREEVRAHGWESVVRTAAAEGVVLGGTLSANIIATGGPIAGTAVAEGFDALGTRSAEQPSYRCPVTVYTIDSDLNGWLDISGAQLDAAIAATLPESPLIGMGQSFVDTGRRLDINPYYIAAHAAFDSAWGTSAVATGKNNLFGYGVTPSCPFDCAVPFNSREESISFVTALVKADYLTPGGRFYTTPTLRGMEPIYSGNPDWAEGIAAIMNLLRQNTPCP